MLNTKENGEKIKPMVVESSGMQMEISTRVNGKMTRLMAMVSIFMLTALNTKDIGKMICKMDKVWRAGKTEVDTMVAIKKA